MKGDHSKSWCLCLCYSFPPYLSKVKDDIHAFLYFPVLCTTKKKKKKTYLKSFQVYPYLSQNIKEQENQPFQNQVIQPQTAEFIFPSFWPCVKRGLFSWLWLYLRNTHCKGSLQREFCYFKPKGCVPGPWCLPANAAEANCLSQPKLLYQQHDQWAHHNWKAGTFLLQDTGVFFCCCPMWINH